MLPRSVIALLFTIYNACNTYYIPLSYGNCSGTHVTQAWSTNTSNRQIRLLPNLSKVFVRFLLRRLQVDIDFDALVPVRQFDLLPKHSTIHQAHRIVTKISQPFEEKKYYTTAFLYVSQELDKV